MACLPIGVPAPELRRFTLRTAAGRNCAEAVGSAGDHVALASGETLASQLLWVLVSCVVLWAVFFPLAMWAYRRKI